MNTSPLISGLAVNLVTPFNANGDIDFPALEKLVRRIRASNIQSIFINASSSEASMLDEDEQDRVADSSLRSMTTTKHSLGGYQGCPLDRVFSEFHPLLSLVLQPFIATSPCLRHLHLQATSVIFDPSLNPPRYRFYLSTKRDSWARGAEEAILSLAEEQNIIGMVESTGDVALNGAIIRRKPASFSVLSGRDVMVLPLMALGIDGAISTVANAFPVECARMMDQMAFGNFHDARETHHLLAPILRILETEGAPTGIKALLNHFQMMEHLVRLPNTPVSDEMRTDLYRALAELPHTMVDSALDLA